MKIRSATVEDAERLLEIYAYYVEHTAISFEYDVPSAEEFRRRIEETLQAYPYSSRRRTAPFGATLTLIPLSAGKLTSVPPS